MEIIQPKGERPNIKESTDLRASSPISAIMHASISWRAIFAGLFLSLLSYLVLVSLGVAIGSAVVPSVIQGGRDASGLGVGSGIWLIVSLIVSLFVGSYLSSRVSGLMPSRIGGVQGIIVAALFFTVLLSGIGSTLSGIGKGLGGAAGALGSAAGDLSENPQIQATVEDAIGELNLKSPPGEVIRGITTRMIRGDTEGARNYLARQAGISPEEAEQRIQSFQTRFQGTAQNVGVQVAHATAVAAWTLFGALVLGALSGWLGGKFGMKTNLKRSIGEAEVETARRSRTAA